MCRVTQRNDTDALRRRHGHCPIGGKQGIQNAWTLVTVIDFDGTELFDDFRLGIGHHPAALQIVDEAGNAIQTVRVNAVATRFGMHLSANTRRIGCHAGFDKSLGHHLMHQLK